MNRPDDEIILGSTTGFTTLAIATLIAHGQSETQLNSIFKLTQGLDNEDLDGKLLLSFILDDPTVNNSMLLDFIAKLVFSNKFGFDQHPFYQEMQKAEKEVIYLKSCCILINNRNRAPTLLKGFLLRHRNFT